MVSLSGGVLIQSSIIHDTPRGAIAFRRDHHPATPCHGVVNLHFLQHSKTDISIKPIFDSLLPMKWYLARGVCCNWVSFLIDKNAERRRVFHQTQGLMFTNIKSTCLEPIQYELAQLGKILGCWGTRKHHRTARRDFSSWARIGIIG